MSLILLPLNEHRDSFFLRAIIQYRLTSFLDVITYKAVDTKALNIDFFELKYKKSINYSIKNSLRMRYLSFFLKKRNFEVFFRENAFKSKNIHKKIYSPVRKIKELNMNNNAANLNGVYLF